MRNGNKGYGRFSGYALLLTIALSMIFIGGLFGGLVQSDWGKVSVSGADFPTRDGQHVSADLYKPKSATFENKAPLIVVVAGFQRSKETQSGISLELARRGFVVINIDPYSQGDSSSSVGRESAAVASYEGYGAFDVIDYIYDSGVLSYVDVTRIGITGHSAGGNAAYQAAIHFGKDAVNNGGVSKVHSAYISGYVISINKKDMKSFAKSNMGFDYALYDEGAFRNEPVDAEGNLLSAEDGGTPVSDMTAAAEAHDFVNSVLTDEIPYNTPVELGKIYGNPFTRTMRQVYNTATIHALQPYAGAANESLLNFFEVAMDMEYSVPSGSHIWWLKEAFTTLALVGAFIFIVPFAVLLLKIPFFQSVKTDVPPPIKRRTVRKKIIFWTTFALSAAVAALTYIPMAGLSATIFPKATASVLTWAFPQRMNNAVMLWAVLNGIAGMIIFLACFFGTYFVKKGLHAWSKSGAGAEAAAGDSAPVLEPAPVADADGAAGANSFRGRLRVFGRKAKAAARIVGGKSKSVTLAALGTAAPEPLSTESWGIKIKPLDLLKTFLLALSVTGGFYLLLHAVYALFHVDFRFLFVVSARTLNLKVFLQTLMYVPFFFIFYFANSIRVNGNMREDGQREWLSLLIAGFSNTAGLICILAIQYIAFGATGTVYWTETPEMTHWLYINILFGLIPVMFVLPLFNRWFFRATGRSWLGPMVMSLIFISMMINNSVAYIPI
jgi:fermentation-respiration switch protein FrsA (DUF1100 family)